VVTHQRVARAGVLRLTPEAAMGLYLETFVWTHFATLTVAGMVGRDAIREMFARFNRRLASVVRRAVPYFFAIERSGVTGVSPHIHALLAQTDDLTVRTVSDAWKHGLKCVRVYDRARGAATYTSKGLLRNPDDWGFSRRLPAQYVDDRARSTLGLLGSSTPAWPLS